MTQLPYDPDFDQQREQATGQNQSAISLKIKPQTMFVAGLIGGVMVLCTIGFFILLSIFLKGGVSLSAKTTKTEVALNQPSPSPAQLPNLAPAPPAGGPVPPVTKDDHVRGNLSTAKVVLIEYSDTECPFCKRFHPTMQQAVKEYGDKVAWVYRHYPLSFHANAQKEAEASECATELGGNKAFWTYLDKIFERTTSNGTGFALTALAPLAKEIGLNDVAFQKCLDSGKYAKLVQSEESGGAAAGVQGTPGTFVVGKNGSQLIPGALPYESIKQAIDAAL